MALVLGTVRMAGDQAHTVHPFFLSSKAQPTKPSLPTADSASSKADRPNYVEVPELDEESGRRSPKRRRTASPEAPLGQRQYAAHGDWRQQLQMAASKSDNLGIMQVLDGTYSKQEIPSIDGAMELRPTMEENKPIVLKNQAAASPTPLDLSVELNITSERHSPKKKMLKLSSDGKLGSPGSRTSKGSGKAKGKMKKADTESPKSKVVIVSYGSDNLSRAEVGAKIEAILSGFGTMPVESPPTVQQARKSDQPPKPTHPFFVAKAQRTKSDGLLPLDPTTENAGQGRKRSPSPRKKAGIKNAQAAAAWANISGFGSAPANSPASNLPRLSGLVEPSWPPRDMSHVRGSMAPVTEIAQQETCVPESQKKLKALAVEVTEHEDILKPYVEFIYHFGMDSRKGFDTAGRDVLLRKPVRRLMTSHELQQSLQQKVCSTMLRPSHAFQASEALNLEATVSQGESQYGLPHSAVLHIFDSLPHSQSAFDRFECETEEWTHKYAPKSAADVLQHGREAFFLRDWLKSLTVASVQNGKGDASNSRAPLNLLKQGGAKTRRKRKRTDEFAGFMISSDEEASEMGELSGSEDSSLHESSRTVKKSVIRSVEVASSGLSSVNSARCTNAIVISGPHGCGKTAAVYAVAEELGFEVFEINPGSRRSGKDLLDKVGDMTRNHLVHQASDPKSSDDIANQHEESLQKDLDSGRQSTMKGFFKSKSGMKNLGNQSRSGLPASSRPSKPSKKQNHQKQSLILLEEVDILFEEDKQFWTTALGMISQSKRPIIMTCTDESQLPIEDMALHAIFRFHPPSEHLVTDYLVLVAGSEGHLISRDAICASYKANNNDLRATIMGLNFWCQMGIGDDKGGLEWMPIPSSPESYINSQYGKQRVISENTFITSMVQLPLSCSDKDLIEDRSIVQSSYTKINLEASSGPADSTSRQKSVELLKLVDLALDAVSFADVFPGSRLMDDTTALLDTTQPDLPEGALANYIDGFHLLQADPIQDFTGLSMAIPSALQAFSESLLLSGDSSRTANQTSNQWTMKKSDTQNPRYLMIREILNCAFSSLYESPKMPCQTFLTPVCQIVEDVAPYVRAIVSYDLRLEARRLHLSSLLSQGGAGGKRQRTTRASRAALEGGSKSSTRRERWFPKDTNFTWILQTGGDDWQEIALRLQEKDVSEGDACGGGSRRSSFAGTESED